MTEAVIALRIPVVAESHGDAIEAGMLLLDSVRTMYPSGIKGEGFCIPPLQDLVVTSKTVRIEPKP